MARERVGFVAWHSALYPTPKKHVSQLRFTSVLLPRRGSLEAMLGSLGLLEGGMLGSAGLERFVRQLLPGAAEGAVSYAATSLGMCEAGGSGGGLSTDMLAETVR